MVQCVECPGNKLTQMSPMIYHMELLTPQPQPSNEDPCESHTVSCNPAGSTKVRGTIWASAIISCILVMVPLFRVLQLQPGRNEDNTLFWWFLCLGSASCAVWWCYFSACSSRKASVFPILLASIFGLVVQVCLTFAATFKTPAPEDGRAFLVLFVPLVCFMVAYGLKRSIPVQYTGWFGLSLAGLSHSFRVSSTIYRDNFNIWQFLASVLGSVGGFLWLGHPQLCLSREYKITSYVIAVIRATEAIMMCSHAIARQLWRIEGYAVPAQAENVVAPGGNQPAQVESGVAPGGNQPAQVESGVPRGGIPPAQVENGGGDIELA